jgi:hypothetical protein
MEEKGQGGGGKERKREWRERDREGGGKERKKV